MADFESSTLWRVSKFDLLAQKISTTAHAALDGPSMLSSTLQAELHALERRQRSADVVEVFAACLRLREPALVYLQVEEMVWPITVFPADNVYHSCHNLVHAFKGGMVVLKTIGVEPPGVPPPGRSMHERTAQSEHYRTLDPALWQLALHGPRASLLEEIGGTAAYRALRSPSSENLPTPGALGPAVERLRREAAAVRHIAQWPGMSIDRATRLLNALYLTSNLMITRGHTSARAEPGRGLLNHRPR